MSDWKIGWVYLGPIGTGSEEEALRPLGPHRHKVYLSAEDAQQDINTHLMFTALALRYAYVAVPVDEEEEE